MTLTTLGTAGAALAIVLGLVLACARLAARLRAGQAAPVSGRSLAVQETLQIDTRRRLVLLRCGEQRFLLLAGTGPDILLPLTKEPA
jgi:flagellar protein FliO/FliZ